MLPYVVPEEKDAKGKQIYPSRNVTVKKEEVIFEKEYTIITGQELPAGSHHKFTGNIEIPAHLPPSVKGKYAQIRWRGPRRDRSAGRLLLRCRPQQPLGRTRREVAAYLPGRRISGNWRRNVMLCVYEQQPSS